MTRTAHELGDQQLLEEALRSALKSVLGGPGSGVKPRAGFYNKLQREMEEHDQDLEKKYDEDLNVTLIFSGLFSAVTSAFIIDIQSELKPDYQQMNNALLEMLLNATTGALPADPAASVPRWSGPYPVIVQVQCILYATLFATLLAAFLAMLGKQWLSRYKQNETRGSAADRSRVRERKLTGLETWKFHIVMESLPLILQCSLVLLGFALSRYLWEVNTSVSSVVIGFTSFVFLFYSSIVTASVFSFNCPFQTPFSLLIRFAIGLAAPHLRNLLRTFVSTQRPFQLGMLQARFDLPLPTDGAGGGHGLETGITSPPPSITPFFIQKNDLEGERLDARCIDRLLKMSTDADVVISIMDFIPEVLWHSGIKTVPLECIYNILIDCFDFSGAHPVVIPKSRDMAYVSARAFVHIELQRRCIAQHEEQGQDSWRALCVGHRLLSSADYGSDHDLAATLSMVDMTLGYDFGPSWGESGMTPSHRAWMSHALLYLAWNEGKVSELVIDFVKDSLSLESPGDAVITDCFFIIGLTVGVTFHVSDITVRDKRSDVNVLRVRFTDSPPSSLKKGLILADIFGALETIIFSRPIQMPLALRALRLVTLLSDPGVHYASHVLFETIMASDNMEEWHWEVARLAIRGALGDDPPFVNGPKKILKFLDYHVCLQGAGEDHGPDIACALLATIFLQEGCYIDLLTHESVWDFDWTSLSFVRGICSVMRPHNPIPLRGRAAGLIALLSDRWFDHSVPVMKPEDMAEFCENIAILTDTIIHKPGAMKEFVTVLFGMLSSPVWRTHIVARFWSLLAYCNLVRELESVRWCFENAIELLEFTRGLPDGEGSKWWYGTLWFHYDKLDTTARDEVKKIAVDMVQNDGLSDLNLYLGLIQEEIARIRREINGRPDEERVSAPCRKMRARLIILDGNYDQLSRITGRR